LKAHPEEVVRALRGVLGMRVGVPLDAFRYLARELLQGQKAPKDVLVEAQPPGLRLGATVRAMGATLRVRLAVYVEELAIGAEQALITARIADLAIEVLDGADTPVAGLIQSGALDLSKPGNLVAYMPKRPAMLVEAEDDRLVVDLLKIPKLEGHRRIRRLLAVLTPMLTVAAIKSRDDHLDLHLKLTPAGVATSLSAARSPSG